ncbi:MAG TPA: biopolymer transporter ExbD [Planctomycetota bacterium]|nr:biopolymer transporter ExbD [Planctomycetota bacterium]
MAGKRMSEAANDAAEMNMTPMIDCVFQLLIFFMVCTEIKKSDDAEVELPRTRRSDIDKPVPRNRVVISCTWTSSDVAGGARVADQLRIRNRSFDCAGLPAWLEKLDREDRSTSGRPLRTVSGPESQSGLYVKIRADARCEWRTIQMAQAACMQAGIYKISYGSQPAGGPRASPVGAE